MKKYQLEVTEEQLQLIADCVEDIHRFMSGQCMLANSLSMLDNYMLIRNKLDEIKPLVTPQLSANEAYGWNGGNCPNKSQQRFIAKTYGIYREILHVLISERSQPGDCNVYLSPTKTCKDSEPLPTITRIDKDQN